MAGKKTKAKRVTKKGAVKKKANKKKVIAETKRSRTVLKHTKASVDSFFSAYSTVRQERGAGQRAPTNTEQDLTRAALVFAAAGLDSAIRNLFAGHCVN